MNDNIKTYSLHFSTIQYKISNLYHKVMELIQIKHINKAHGSEDTDDCGQIQALLSLPDRYISVGLDSSAKVWSYQHKLINKAAIDGDYPLCIKHIDNQIVIGNGRGEILFFDAQLRQQKTVKVAKDTISDILTTQTHIIVLSHDGTVTILLRTDLSLHKKIDLLYPVHQICSYQDSFYVAGSNSWKISADFELIESIQRSEQFLVYGDQLLAVSPTKGFYSYTRQLFSHQPCDKLEIIDNQIIGFFSEGISLFSIGEDQIQTRSQVIKGWRSGYIVKSICLKPKGDFLVGREDGLLTDLKLFV